jgi:hypothetical protein
MLGFQLLLGIIIIIVIVCFGCMDVCFDICSCEAGRHYVAAALLATELSAPDELTRLGGSDQATDARQPPLLLTDEQREMHRYV